MTITPREFNPKGTILGNEPPEALTLNIPAWTADALCAQADPEEWFPERGGSNRSAKRICGRCPVQTQCLQYALDNDEGFGIFGGLSVEERRRLKAGKPIEQRTGTCQVCGDEFNRSQWNQKYCSTLCRSRGERERQRRQVAA